MKSSLQVGDKAYAYYRLQGLEEQGIGEISKLPFSIKVLLEAAVRQFDGRAITKEHVQQLANWTKDATAIKKCRSCLPVLSCKTLLVFLLS